MNAQAIYNVGPWAIEKDGTMVHNSPEYIIDGDRLREDNWIQHMAEKRWCDLRVFVRAYLLACQTAGLRSVTINTSKMF